MVITDINKGENMFKVRSISVKERKLKIEIEEGNDSQNENWELIVKCNDIDIKVIKITSTNNIQFDLPDKSLGNKLRIYKKSGENELFIKSKYIPTKIDWVSKQKYNQINNSLINRVLKVIGE